MARLNELPVCAENVDALKRRFIRQNRELARHNSAQSIRIRSLEAEVSRLLGENVSFRERIVELEATASRTTGRAAQENTLAIKSRLEAKVVELGGLIAELGSLNNRKSLERDRRRSSLQKRISSDQRNWKNTASLPEATNGQAAEENKLPTIVEGKYYPRRTLEPAELQQGLSEAANDSPELGPPPVAHFTDEDPIRFDPVSHISTVHEPGADGGQHEALEPVSSVNLEIRRRRRESGLTRFELRKNPNKMLDQVIAAERESEEIQQPTRVGAKRKLSSREDSDTAQDLAALGAPADFAYSRKQNAENAVGWNVERPQQQSDKPVVRVAESTRFKDPSSRTLDGSAASTKETSRKVLGQKSVNTDPLVSPKKPITRTSSDTNKEKEPLKKDQTKRVPSREASRCRGSITHVPPLPPPDVVKATTVEDIYARRRVSAEQPSLGVPLRTQGAGLDLPSPTSTTPPCTAQANVKPGTPPPQDGETRPSRRARNSVNYAEPALNTKMRRPGKELVDAVAREERRKMDEQRAEEEETMKANGFVEINRELGMEKSKGEMRTVVIKRERSDGADKNSWKTLPLKGEPISPLPAYDVGQDKEARQKQSASREGDDPAAAELEGAMHKLEIYDFNESPPVDGQRAQKARMAGRRKSTIEMQRDRVSGERKPRNDDTLSRREGGREDEVERRERAAARRRRSMML